ncbi:MAG TPA: preprotein translocase subunit YajC [bacterium]|nr:preprotein translocase subunit YajC [Myxococcales bacterium]OQA60914.1 MAG: preprotein translocase subunit YajC [bacterium ADurb.Bin270]HPW44793.1 preprotein translocase subunit YajC [bacterium]HQC51172.1 preprotein translocase subunit YajC [bacterium]HQG12804.1 preprotein translocase subunit YajC [bacterium]
MLGNIAVAAMTAMAARPAGADGQQGSWITSLMPLAVIFAIFYFLLIRPQQKQQKKHRGMIEALKKGDRIITRGGMHGTIHGIANNIITLEVAPEIRIKFNREAVAGLANAEENNQG